MAGIVRLNSTKAMLLIIDVQEAFLEPVKKMKSLVKRCCVLAQAANILALPIVVTEQYPKGLGHTAESLAAVLGNHTLLEKTSFSCMAEPQAQEAIMATQKEQVIIAGVETHVCVLQTALDLLAAGKEVFVVDDAVSSRDSNDRQAALARMAQAGAVITTAEAVLMELIGGSRHEHFKAIQNLIK